MPTTRPTTPREARDSLLAGNRRFLADEPIGPNRGLDRMAALARGQEPWATILGCADSRVPLEILFDAGFGDIFVVRVAGNVASSETVASIEYSVEVLGTPLVVVLGHTGCGAVQAAVDNGRTPGRIPALLRQIRAAIPSAETTIDQAVEANVRHQIQALLDDSSDLRDACDDGRIMLVGAVVDTATGEVRIVDERSSSEG
ncbi:carbonic anhydrase [Gaopeijia maritima]|uniref:carbonic anhydrase n=1 Tax=Gaopeijia maritima TaxID=3119007 RepID=A0ABU9E3Z9_9BACT